MNSTIDTSELVRETPRLYGHMSWSQAAADLLSSLQRKSSHLESQRSQNGESLLTVETQLTDIFEGMEIKVPNGGSVDRRRSLFNRLFGRCKRAWIKPGNGLSEVLLLVDNTASSGWQPEDSKDIKSIGRRSASLAYPNRAQIHTEILVSVPGGEYESCSVIVNDFSTAAEVCKAVDPSIDLLHWQLEEVLEEGQLSLVRLVEDHEPVGYLNKLRCEYNCRHSFQITKTNSKYNMAFGENQEDATSSLTECIYARSLPRQVNRPWPTPALTYVNSGFLWFRLPGKPWRKHFCFLHGSSVFYSTRRNETSSRNMRLLVDLSLMHIWTLPEQKKKNSLRAPTPHLLICRPITTSRVGLLTSILFATRTVEGRLVWETSFRIHKYGLSRLKSNYHEAECSNSSSRADGFVDETDDVGESS